MKNDFCAWLAQAKPGDRFEYHRGFLAADAGAKSKNPLERKALRETSKLILQASQTGLVHLVQQRRGFEDYRYLAIRSRA